MQFIKACRQNKVLYNSIVLYEIKYENIGNMTASNVYILDSLPCV